MSDTTTVWDVANSRGDWVLNASILSRQPVALASPLQFGGGDGATTQYQLLPGQNIDTIVAQIFRNDWQGNQLLYATPRTNFLLQSQAFDNAAWSKNSVTATAAATTAPDGTITGEKWADSTATNVPHTLFQNVAGQSSQTVSTLTVYAQAADRNFLTLRKVSISNTANFNFASFDLSAGVFSNVGNGGTATGATATMTPVGGGWYRCTLSGISDPSGTGGVQVIVAAPLTLGGSVVYTGVVGQGIYVWGSQLELGAVSTNYIPTTTSAATVTDYVLSPYGLVMLSSPPVLGAALTWTGSYVLNSFAPGGALATGNDLQTAVLISLFTDRVAASGDVIPDGTTDPRGWIGDLGETYPIGSRFWLLDRSKQTNQVLKDAQAYADEALKWLIDDGVVAKLDITVEWTRPGMLGIQIIAHKPNGTTVPPFQFQWAWKGQ